MFSADLTKHVLLHGVGADVHAETQTGDTSLTYACENGHTDVAKVLLERGAKLVSHLLFSTSHYLLEV